MSSAFHWRASRHLRVLAYHGVADDERFAAQLDLLAREAHPIALDDLLVALAGGTGLPRKAVLVTFDDADPSHARRALPLLRERAIPAVAFVVTGVVDTHVPFWWNEVTEVVEAEGSGDGSGRKAAHLVAALKRVPDGERLSTLEQLRRNGHRVRAEQITADEIRELAAAGIAIGNHTVTHPILPRCPDAKVQAEIAEAHEALSRLIGHTPRVFAYPNGDADQRSVRVLESLGYEAAFLFDHRICTLPVEDRFRVSRLRINGDDGLDQARAVLSGAHPAIHRLLGRP